MNPFDNYEIHGYRTYAEAGKNGVEAFAEQCPDSEAEYWTLFGHVPGQGLETIRDFPTREAAEEMFRRITGMPYASTGEVQARLRVMHAGERLLSTLRGMREEIEELSGQWTERLATLAQAADAGVAATTSGTPIQPLLDPHEALLLASQYIQYVKEWNPALHQEADGIPSIEAAVAAAIRRAA